MKKGNIMRRSYEAIIKRHFEQHEQMLLMAGPRQVGKTTLAKTAEDLTEHFLYLNYDSEKHRRIILAGEDVIFPRFAGLLCKVSRKS